MKKRNIWIRPLAVLLMLVMAFPWLQVSEIVRAEESIATISAETEEESSPSSPENNTGADASESAADNPAESPFESAGEAAAATAESSAVSGETDKASGAAGTEAEESRPAGPAPSDLRGNPRALPRFKVVEENGGWKIINWDGTFNDPDTKSLIIPDTYTDPLSGQEKRVLAIDSGDFEHKEIAKLSIGAYVETIGNNVFLNNEIDSLVFAETEDGWNSLKTIGDNAFASNNLQNIVIPANVESIGVKAFSDTKLSSLSMGEKVKSIGDGAFEKNELRAVTLPDGISSFGDLVFVDNGRFVAVSTKSPQVKKFEKTLAEGGRNRYGHVIDPITVTVRYVNSETQDVLLTRDEGDDLTKDNVFVKGETVQYNTEKISGYYVADVVELTPQAEGDVLDVPCTPLNTPPKIELLDNRPSLSLNVSEEEAKQVLLSVIKVTDLTGADITEDATVDISDLDTNSKGSYNVTYHVTDRFGNEATLPVEVDVTDSWENFEIGDSGWVMGDFTYYGSSITGFSETGLNKYNAGNKDLVLPAFTLKGSPGNMSKGEPVKRIGDYAFRDKKITSVDFSNCTELEYIGVYAFSNTSLTALDFNQLPALKYIGSYAFLKSAINNLDFSPAVNLETIGYASFSDLQGGLKSLNFGTLPKLKTIENYALCKTGGSNQMSFSEKIDLTGLTALEKIGACNFRYSPAVEIDLTGLVNLKSIHAYAFQSNTSLNEGKGRYITGFETLTGLEEIHYQSFKYCYFPTIDMSKMPNLRMIAYEAFKAYRQDYKTEITFPQAQDGVQPRLYTIDKGAFENRKIDSVVMENLPELTKIAENVFCNSGMSELKLSNLPVLNLVGDNAFSYGKLTEVEFSGVPSLQKVPYKAFQKNTGVPRYGNKVVIWDTTEKEHEIPSTSSFIVNPRDPEDEDYNAEDFRYGWYQGEWSILGFTEKGLNKLLNGRRTITFPEKDPKGTLITGISKEAFAGMDFDKADLSNLSKLKVIGESAFENSTVKDFDFTKLPNLLSIKEAAFRQTKLTTADFSGNPKLNQIGSTAFYDSKVESVNFENNPAMTKLEGSIFAGTPITKINFSGLPNVTEIGSYAFSGKVTLEHELDLSPMKKLVKINNYAFQGRKMDAVNLEGLTQLSYLSGFDNTGLKTIDFSQVPAVETIGGSAFRNTSLGQVDLSVLPELSRISNQAFDTAGLADVNFGELPKLKRIDYYAFRNNSLRSLDMSGLAALEDLGSNYTFAYNYLTEVIFPENAPLSKINSYVFADNPLRVLEIPAGITTVSDYAFAKSNYINMKTALLTPGHDANGGKLKDSPDSVDGGHIIDAKFVKVHYLEAGSNKELRPSYLEINTTGGELDYHPLIIPGYVAESGKKTVNFDTDQYEHEVIFYYDPVDYQTDPNNDIKITHTNKGKEEGLVGSNIVTTFTMDCSRMSAPVRETVHALISFDPTFISNVVVGKSNLYTVNVDKENGLIDLSFPAGLTTGTKLNTDIAWKFKSGPTPQNYELTLPTELRGSDGRMLTFSTNEEGQKSFPTIRSVYETPTLYKGYKDDKNEIKYLDGQKEAGAVSKDGSLRYVKADSAADIVYVFKIGHTFSDPILQREISEVKIIDQLPTYKAYQDGSEVERYAVFDPLKNPDWVLDPETHTVSYTKTFSSGSDKTGTIPELVLSYPEAVITQDSLNTARAELTPHNQTENEPIIETKKDDLKLTLLASKEPPAPTKDCGLSKNAEDHFFRDYPTDKEQSFVWYISFIMAAEEREQNKFFKQLVLHDEIDPRMMYTELTLPANAPPVTIKGVRADGTEEVAAENVKGTYTFEAGNTYTKFILDFGDEEIHDDVRMSVKSVLRNPELRYNYDDIEKNVYVNRFYGHVKRYLEDGSFEADMSWDPATDHPGDYDQVTMLPLELSVEPVKSSTYAGEMNSPGTEGSFTVGVRRHLSDTKNSPDEYDIDIPQFKLIDVLPEGVLLEGEPRMSPEFAMCPGAKVTTHFGYGDIEERVVIVYEADILKKNVSTVGSFDTELDMLIKGGLVTNTVYMTFDRAHTEYVGANPGSFVPEFGDGLYYMTAKDNFSVLEVSFINVAKYIRTAKMENGSLKGTSQWSNLGTEVDLGSYFQYLIRIDNLSETTTEDNEIFEVLPYAGDKMLQMGSDGTRESRLSRFANTFLDAKIISEKFKADYDIYYTADTIDLPDGTEGGDYLKTLSWSKTKPANPTALRIKPNKPNVQIKPTESLLIQLDMQAPPDTEEYRQMGGASAYNTCLRRSKETGNTYAETNRVYNRIPYPTGTLRLVKRSRVNLPESGKKNYIEGAEFALINNNGTVVGRAVTDAAGEAVFENVRIDDYVLRETVVPEGYETPETDLFVKAQEWMRKVDQNYLYDLGEIVNEPVFKGKLYLEKTDGENGALQGVEFMLEKIGDAEFKPIKLRTDSSGRVEFTELSEGTYKLSETRTLNNLSPNGVIKVNGQETFDITYPDQIYSLTLDKNSQIVNDKVNIKTYKLGLTTALDTSKELSDFTLNSGRVVSDDVTFEVREKDGSEPLPLTIKEDHRLLENLSTNKVYTLEETAVSERSIYKRNAKVYDFMVDLQGKIYSPDGDGFKQLKSKDIYFPNERKDMAGQLTVSKTDPSGSPLPNALFGLNRLDEESNKYVPSDYEPVLTNEEGLAVFENLAPGSYELKEIEPPTGYVGEKRQVRFVVEEVVNRKMAEDEENYIFTDDKVIHSFTIEAVNYPLNMDFIKVEPVARNVSEAEADALLQTLSTDPMVFKEASGAFFNVWRKLPGAAFTLKEIDREQNETVLFENREVKADGTLDLADVKWNARSTYIFTETAGPGGYIFDAEHPNTQKITIPNYMTQAGFDGQIRVRFENYPTRGSIVVSKYERLSSKRLPGAVFELTYIKDINGNPPEESDQKTFTATTGESGFIQFANLKLGTYELKETQAPPVDPENPDAERYLNPEKTHEITLTEEKTKAYFKFYNVRQADIFDIPVDIFWRGDEPAAGEKVLLKLSLWNEAAGKYEEVETVSVSGAQPEYTFKDLYAQSSGVNPKPLLYKVEQFPPEGYRTVPYSADEKASYFEVKKEDGLLKYKDGDTFAEAPEVEVDGEKKQGLLFENYKLIDILVSKAWDDADSPSARPDKIRVQLLKNAAAMAGKEAEIRENNGVWEYVFRDLDQADENGRKITYTVQEDHVDYYYTTYAEPAEGGRSAQDEAVDLTLGILNTVYPQIDLHAKKTLQYKRLPDKEFDFLIYTFDSSGNPAELPGSVSNDADGKLLFANVLKPTELTAAGVGAGEDGDHALYYVIKEDETVAYYSKDDSRYAARVYVTAPEDGAAEAVTHVEYYVLEESAGEYSLGRKLENIPVFSNTYLASGEWQPSAVKYLDGRELKMNEFTFVLKQLEGKDELKNNTDLQSKTNGRKADGQQADKSIIDFDAIAYDQSDIGKVYRYEFREEAAEEKGMSSSEAVFTAEVTISDAGSGHLKIDTVYKDGDGAAVDKVEFLNTYKASGSASPEAVTDLVGRPLKEDDFSFTIKQINGKYPEKNGKDLDVATNGRTEDGAKTAVKFINFKDFKYDEKDIGKTYTYELRENPPEEDGLSGDPSVYTMTVVITDKGNGELAVDVSYTKDGEEIQGLPSFHNTYKAEGSYVLAAEKVLSGRSLLSDEFSFKLKQITGPNEADNGELIQTVTNGVVDENNKEVPGRVEFEALAFTQDDIGKTYEYQIFETAPAENGMTGDESIAAVTLTVSDGRNGTLNFEVKYNEKDELPVFRNNYEASGSFSPRAEVTLSGRELTDSEFCFKFEKLTEGADPETIETKANGREASGDEPAKTSAIDFSDLSFTQDDIGKTYTYRMTQLPPTEEGITADLQEVTMKITVHDKKNGELGFTLVYEKNGTEIEAGSIPVFENIYEAEGSKTLLVQKVLSGRALSMGEFTFDLKQIEGPDASLNGEILQSVQNGRKASAEEEADDPSWVDFAALEFDQESINKTWTYEISERSPEEQGMSGDSSVYRVVIAITDARNGKLEISESYYKEQEAVAAPIIFNNGYEAEGFWAPYAEKELAGRKAKADEFGFELKQIQGPDQALDGEVLEIAHNGRVTVEGEEPNVKAVDFKPLRFDENAINQTYYYELRERRPEKEEKGMTYSESVFTAEVKVTDDKNGVLHFTVSWTDAEGNVVELPVFENSYKAEGSTEVTASVELKGRKQEKDEFRFSLKQVKGPNESKDGTVIQTAGNDKKGGISFGELQFTQDDIGKTYVYEVSQIVPDKTDPNMEYDKSFFRLSIHIEDAGNGELSIKLSFEKDGTEAADRAHFVNVYTAPADAGKTGQARPQTAAAMMLLAAAAALILLRKREREEEMK